LFYLDHPMTLSPDVTAALATLEARWGAAAPRRAAGAGGLGDGVGEVIGSLATVPLPVGPDPEPASTTASAEGIVSTGFAELDAILGPGGVPRATSLALRGTGSSGKTTLALRLAAEAQAAGSIVAWLDVARAFDPVEAVSRGVRLPWLVVVTPHDLDEGLAIAGSLLGGRSVDLLVVDLPARLGPGPKPGQIAARLHRLTALARRSGTLLVLLEPPGGPAAIGTAVAESAGLRLELARRAWIRLGRDVVGQATDVVVARNRFGPPGRRAALRILYADGDERDACLARDGLLTETPVHDAPIPVPGKVRDATAPPAMASSPPRPRASPPRAPGDGHPALRLVPDRSGDPDRRRRPAVDGQGRARREPGGAGARGPAGDAARRRAPTRA
jgi:RecA/RadA recombinase